MGYIRPYQNRETDKKVAIKINKSEFGEVQGSQIKMSIAHLIHKNQNHKQMNSSNFNLSD